MTDLGPSPGTAPQSPPGGRWRGWLLELALASVFLILVVERFMDRLAGAPAHPYSDESSHLAAVLHLSRQLQEIPVPIPWLHTLLLSRDSYPNLLYATTLPVMGDEPSIYSARLSLLVFPILHAAAAVLLGRREWGRSAAWAYALIVCCTPLALAYAPLYFVDVPLVAMVGISLILLERCDGFRRPGSSAAFAVVAVAGLLTKWTWIIFLAVPVLVAAACAIHASHTRWSLRLAWAAASSFGVAVIVLFILHTSSTPHIDEYYANGPMAWVCVSAIFAGLALALAWPIWAHWQGKRGYSPKPLTNLWVATGSIALGAGPWYWMSMASLGGRLDHEQNMWTQRGGNNLQLVLGNLETTRLLIPAMGVLLVMSIVIAIFTKRGGWSILPRLAAMVLAFCILALTLPYDPRYLLPLGPLIAGSCVAGWRGLRPRSQWAAAGLVGMLCLASVWGPSLLTDEAAKRWSDTTAANWAAGRLSVPVVAFPLATGRQPSSALTANEVKSMVKIIRKLCGPEFCLARYAPRVKGLHGRAIWVLARYGGVQLEVQEPGRQELKNGTLVLLPQRRDEHYDPQKKVTAEKGFCRSLNLAAGGTIELCQAAK